jgi:hypothetical protein
MRAREPVAPRRDSHEGRVPHGATCLWRTGKKLRQRPVDADYGAFGAVGCGTASASRSCADRAVRPGTSWRRKGGEVVPTKEMPRAPRHGVQRRGGHPCAPSLPGGPRGVSGARGARCGTGVRHVRGREKRACSRETHAQSRSPRRDAAEVVVITRLAQRKCTQSRAILTQGPHPTVPRRGHRASVRLAAGPGVAGRVRTGPARLEGALHGTRV